MRPTTRRLMEGWRRRAEALAGTKERFDGWFMRVYRMGPCEITDAYVLVSLYEKYSLEVNGPDAPFSYYSDMEPALFKFRGAMVANEAGMNEAAKKDNAVRSMLDTARMCGMGMARMEERFLVSCFCQVKSSELAPLPTLADIERDRQQKITDGLMESLRDRGPKFQPIDPWATTPMLNFKSQKPDMRARMFFDCGPTACPAHTSYPEPTPDLFRENDDESTITGTI